MLYVSEYMVVAFQVLPAIEEECKQSAKCAAATKHFAHCEEKINAGQGYHGETCVEELCASSLFIYCSLPLTSALAVRSDAS